MKIPSNAKPNETSMDAEPAQREASSSVAVTEVAGLVDAFIDEEVTARLAYSYWEARGFYGGSPEDDWFRAQNELRTGVNGRPIVTDPSGDLGPKGG